MCADDCIAEETTPHIEISQLARYNPALDVQLIRVNVIAANPIVRFDYIGLFIFTCSQVVLLH